MNSIGPNRIKIIRASPATLPVRAAYDGGMPPTKASWNLRIRGAYVAQDQLYARPRPNGPPSVARDRILDARVRSSGADGWHVEVVSEEGVIDIDAGSPITAADVATHVMAWARREPRPPPATYARIDEMDGPTYYIATGLLRPAQWTGRGMLMSLAAALLLWLAGVVSIGLVVLLVMVNQLVRLVAGFTPKHLTLELRRGALQLTREDGWAEVVPWADIERVETLGQTLVLHRGEEAPALRIWTRGATPVVGTEIRAHVASAEGPEARDEMRRRLEQVRVWRERT